MQISRWKFTSTFIREMHFIASASARKQHTLVGKYTLISEMYLITRRYGASKIAYNYP